MHNWQFWSLDVPSEHAPGGLEVSVVAKPEGMEFGGELITWAVLDRARQAFPSNRDTPESGE